MSPKEADITTTFSITSYSAHYAIWTLLLDTRTVTPGYLLQKRKGSLQVHISIENISSAVKG